MPENRVMTTKDLAKYIQLNEKTIIKMAQNGQIPGVKIANQWRFHSVAIDSYLLKEVVEAPDAKLDELIGTAEAVIPLSRLTSSDCIELDFKANQAEEVLFKLADMAYENGVTFSREDLLERLREREGMLSTAVGKGMAIPHPRNPSSKLFKEPKIIVLRSKAGVEFRAPDERSVHLFFMICAFNESMHLRLLAKISKLLHLPNIKERLMGAEDKEQLIRLFLEFDREYLFPGAV